MNDEEYKEIEQKIESLNLYQTYLLLGGIGLLILNLLILWRL